MLSFIVFVKNSRIVLRDTSIRSLFDMLRQSSQWEAMRKLRRKFHSRHAEFLHRASNSSTELRRFGRHCPHPKDLLDEGILTYRDILQGQPPTTLRGVFAFVSLSYAMDDVMRSENMQSSFSPSEVDFLLWRSSIEDSEEKLVFDQITALIWPHEPSPLAPNDLSFFPSHGHGPRESMQATVDGIFEGMEGHPNFDFSMFDQIASSMDWHFIGDSPVDPSPIDGSEFLDPNLIPEISEIPPDGIFQDSLVQNIPPDSSRPLDTKGLPDILMGTVFFQVVATFIKGTL
jgi:hypothetical protein